MIKNDAAQFSTLACPSWSLDAVMGAAVRLEFDGIGLRFIENEDRLWMQAEFCANGLRNALKPLAD
jgi:hypothetical protein